DNLSNIPEGTVIVNIKTEKESISGKMIKIKAITF
ncbi:MAG: ribosomal protein L2, partial [Saprospiraceae bacterium]